MVDNDHQQKIEPKGYTQWIITLPMFLYIVSHYAMLKKIKNGWHGTAL